MSMGFEKRILLILLILSAVVFSSSLGSINQGDFIRLDPSQSGEFRMSFFNFGDEDVKVKLEVEQKPANWTVSFYPGPILTLPGDQKTRTPGSSPGSGWFRLSTGYYVPTYSARVRVTVAETVYAGDHIIKVIAYTEPTSGAGGATAGISTGQVVSQGRLFTFTVRVNRDGTFYIPYNPIIPVTPQGGNRVTIGNNTIQPTTFGNLMENYVTGFISAGKENETDSLGNIIRVTGDKKDTGSSGTAKITSLEEDMFRTPTGQTPTGMAAGDQSSIGQLIIKIIIILIVVYLVVRWIRS